MNTTLRSRFFAILMSLAIALSFMGLDFAVVSADDTPSEPATATVAVRVNDENNKPAKMYNLTVSSNAAEDLQLAEENEDSNKVVTVFDVLIALHYELFKDEFAADPHSYLDGDFEFNYFSKAYGHEVNTISAKLNNGMIGFMDSTEVHTGDEVAFYTIFDENMTEDKYVFFKEPKPVTSEFGDVSITVMQNEVTYDEESYEPSQKDVPVAGAEVTFKGENGTTVKAVTDENGVASAAFDESGKYTLAVTSTEFPFAALPAEQEFSLSVSPRVYGANLGTGGLENPVNAGPISSYVYYGTYEGKPIKFDVLDKASTDFGGNTVLLYSYETLFKDIFDPDSNIWEVSQIRRKLNDEFYNSAFSAGEQGAIAASVKAEGNDYEDWMGGAYLYAPLNGEKVFILSADEETNPAYGESPRQTNGDYTTLRSPKDGSNEHIACNLNFGMEWISDAGITQEANEYAPAINIDLSKVFMTTAADFDKSVCEAPKQYTSNEWKFTLSDDSQKLNAKSIAIKGNKVTMAYEYTGKGATQLSLLVTDGDYTNGKVLCYGKVADAKKSGTATFELPANFDKSSMKAYVFAEVVNGANATDFAGTPVEVKEKKAAPAPAPALKNGQKAKVSGSEFQVISAKANTARMIKAKNAKSVSVPATVKVNGQTLKVTEIGAKAFTAKKIKAVTVSANVTKIAKNAFKGSKATKVTVKSKKLKKASVKGSLKGSKVKTVKVKVGNKKANKTYVKKYKKIFTKKNAGKKVTVK